MTLARCFFDWLSDLPSTGKLVGQNPVLFKYLHCNRHCRLFLSRRRTCGLRCRFFHRRVHALWLVICVIGRAIPLPISTAKIRPTMIASADVSNRQLTRRGYIDLHSRDCPGAVPRRSRNASGRQPLSKQRPLSGDLLRCSRTAVSSAELCSPSNAVVYRPKGSGMA